MAADQRSKAEWEASASGPRIRTALVDDRLAFVSSFYADFSNQDELVEFVASPAAVPAVA